MTFGYTEEKPLTVRVALIHDRDHLVTAIKSLLRLSWNSRRKLGGEYESHRLAIIHELTAQLNEVEAELGLAHRWRINAADATLVLDDYSLVLDEIRKAE